MPSPDLWAHGPGSLCGASKLAIASPFIPDNTLLPLGMPLHAHTLRISSHVRDEDKEDDPFDLFSQVAKIHMTHSFHSQGSMANSGDYELNLSISEEAVLWGSTYPHPSTSYPNMFGKFDNVEDPIYGPSYFPDQSGNGNGSGNVDPEADYDPDTAAALTDRMTPFNMLSSIFGTMLASGELEKALTINGFEL